jgi:hypothetical protein
MLLLLGCQSQEKTTLWCYVLGDGQPFSLYLASAPKLEDTDSFYECGRQREYSGFDEDYPDDQDICDEIDRLKNTPDIEDFEGYLCRT